MESLKSMWWAALAIGILTLLLGIVALFAPVAALGALVLLYAIYALVGGVFAVIAGFRMKGYDSGWWITLLWGLLGVLVGLYILFNPRTAAVVLFVLFGIWAIVGGMVEIYRAFRLRHVVRRWGWTVVAGVFWVLLGVLFLVAPASTAVATTMVWGIIMTLLGIVSIIALLVAHHDMTKYEEQTKQAYASSSV